MTLYPPQISVEDGKRLKIYTFGGVARDRWNAVKEAAQAVPGVTRIDGDFESGVAMWVGFGDGADQEAADARILALIRAELPDDVPFRRIPFEGFAD